MWKVDVCLNKRELARNEIFNKAVNAYAADDNKR